MKKPLHSPNGFVLKKLLHLLWDHKNKLIAIKKGFFIRRKYEKTATFAEWLCPEKALLHLLWDHKNKLIAIKKGDVKFSKVPRGVKQGSERSVRRDCLCRWDHLVDVLFRGRLISCL